MSRSLLFCRAALAGVLAVMAAPVLGQSKAAPAPDIALYAGPDRMQRLLEGAKKEGRVSVYNSAPVKDMAVLSAAFEKKYGIKVSVWRASSEDILQRAVAESRGGRAEVDIFETNGPEMEALHREKLLREVRSPGHSDLMPEAITPHREWIGTRLNIFSFAYNTRLVKKDELPKSYEELLHPRWKGRLGIESTDHDWFAGVVGQMGEAKGLKLFKDIVAANGMSVRTGHTLLANLVASGEVPMALTVYNYHAEQLKNGGAPIDWFVIPPAFARVQGVGMARRAPNPHAAVLFYDFMLTEAQQMMVKRDIIPTSKKAASPLNRVPVRFIDPKVVLDEHAKWTRLYKETISAR
jgi:iron(III) transport system substrate-binding protein